MTTPTPVPGANFPSHLHYDEAKVISALLDQILDNPKDCPEWAQRFITVINDGMRSSVENSRDRAAIERETGATDFTEYVLTSHTGTRCGWILLIHGNGEDVISDLSVNDMGGYAVECVLEALRK